MLKVSKAIFPLSADPIHNGHLYVIEQALQSGTVDHLICALGTNEVKQADYTFTDSERLQLAVSVLGRYSNVTVVQFSGLLAEYAKLKECARIIRGVRDASDKAYEAELEQFNTNHGLQTEYIQASDDVRDIRSSAIKQAVITGQFVHTYVPLVVKQALEERLTQRLWIGVTGNIASGKTTLCAQLIKQEHGNSIDIHTIDADQLIHELYRSDDSVRANVRTLFGEAVMDGDTVNRKYIAKSIFTNAEKRLQLAQVLHVPFLTALEQASAQLSGIVLLDCAYLVEYDLLSLVNNNVVLARCSRSEKIKRNSRAEQILDHQFNETELTRRITEAHKSTGHGNVLVVDSEQPINAEQIVEHLQHWRILHSSQTQPVY